MAAKKTVAAVMAELETFKGQQVIALALEVRSELVRATRVVTGYARANWQCTVGSPPTQPVGSKGKRGGGTTDAQAIRALAGYSTDQGPVYVSNRVPYVGLSEGGAIELSAVEAAVRRAVAARLSAGPVAEVEQ